MIVFQPKVRRQRALFFRVGAHHPSPRLVDSRPQRAERSAKRAEVVRRDRNPICAGCVVVGSRFLVFSQGLAVGWIFLLHYGGLLLADAGEAFLNQASEFFLAGELNLRVFLGHADGAVASDL